jgi:hypothetical protein
VGVGGCRNREAVAVSAPITAGLPCWWRVTRYDPAFRNERGAYTKDTWISIGDVGEVYDGETLTMQEYERVESAYRQTVKAFADEAGIEQLQVRRWEVGEGLSEGMVLPLVDAVAVVGRMLREEVRCKLEDPLDRFAVHVGFDLYMYIGAMGPCEHAVRRAAELGLFVDMGFVSPYLGDGPP